MRYLLKKVFQMLVTIFILSFIVFYMARLAPGDPLTSYYGDGAERLNQQERVAAMERLGLDKPIWQQYKSWLHDAANGDFGISFKYKQHVQDMIGPFVGNTLILGVSAYALTFVLAICLALFCVYHQGKWLDQLVCKIGVLTASIPSFWIALLLILLFSINLGWLPSSGAYAIGEPENWLSRLQHLILPVLVLVINHLWYYAYMIRNKLVEETRQNYVLLCRVQGMKKAEILWKHCLRNVAPAIITMMALSVPHIIGGTYIVETVFGYPGLGSLVFESAHHHDYNLLMIVTIMTGLLVISTSFISDIVNRAIDPRLRSEDGGVL